MINLAQRLAMIETAYLQWQRQQERTYLHPLSGNFLTDPAGIVGGKQVTEEELRDALEALHARGLISDEGKLVGRLARVVLTPGGLRCLVDHDGDVRAWQVAARPGNVTVHASGNVQAAVNSTNVTQIMHAVEAGIGPVNHDGYTLAASTLLAGLGNLGLRDDQIAELRQAAEEIAAEAAQPQPDDGKLRRWGGVIVKGLGAVTTSTLATAAARYIIELLSSAS